MLFIFFVVLFSTASAQFGFLTNYRCYSIPPKPVNGRYEYVGTGITRYSTVRYVCDSGFTLQGSSYNSCQNQRWTLQVPLCIPTDPCRPRNPCAINADCIRTFSSYECICEAGYSGDGKRRCSRTCSPPYDWNNAEYSPDKSEYVEFEKILYTCDDGFVQRNKDTPRQTCYYGHWSGPRPTCIRTLCDDPFAPDNGRISPQSRLSWNNGDIVTYTCDTGFQLVGDRVTTCRHKNSFANPPECVAACPAPTPPADGAIDPADKPFFLEGESLTYSCLNETVLSGIETASCTNHVFPPSPICNQVPLVEE